MYLRICWVRVGMSVCECESAIGGVWTRTRTQTNRVENGRRGCRYVYICIYVWMYACMYVCTCAMGERVGRGLTRIPPSLSTRIFDPLMSRWAIRRRWRKERPSMHSRAIYAIVDSCNACSFNKSSHTIEGEEKKNKKTFTKINEHVRLDSLASVERNHQASLVGRAPWQERWCVLVYDL